jgi:hypothetical protein
MSPDLWTATAFVCFVALYYWAATQRNPKL